jgi:hypothetical protein
MVFTYLYDTSFNPSMPVVELGIRRELHDAQREVVLKALVDSGSDATIIPLRHLKAIRAKYSRTMHLRGVTGVRIPVDVYQITLRIGSHLIPSILSSV